MQFLNFYYGGYMFWKKTAMIIQVDNKERKVSFEELTLSNSLSLEALVRTLVKKGIISSEDFVNSLEEIQKERSIRKDERKDE